MEFDIVKLIDVLGDASSFSLLILAIWGGFTGKYVWRWTYDDRVNSLIAERDEWKAIARQGLNLSKAAINSASSGNP